jgi:LytS/YehU family sensor histidine kinase
MVLENSEQKEIPLSDEVKALELYLELEALRANNRFTFEIKIENDIDADNTLVPPLLMQPFVENSIRHGLSEKEGAGKIMIHFAIQDDMLICNIEDNGIGLEKSKAIKNIAPQMNKKSLGIKITQSRINILNQHKKNKIASMKIRDAGHGTNVEIKLPLVLNF